MVVKIFATPVADFLCIVLKAGCRDARGALRKVGFSSDVARLSPFTFDAFYGRPPYKINNRLQIALSPSGSSFR